MKIVQLILRIILSPIVFILVCFSFALVLGPLMLILGIGVLFGRLLGCGSFIDSLEDDVIFAATIIFWYPFYITKQFISNSKEIKSL